LLNITKPIPQWPRQHSNSSCCSHNCKFR